jgi:hypothetical protein
MRQKVHDAICIFFVFGTVVFGQWLYAAYFFTPLVYGGLSGLHLASVPEMIWMAVFIYLGLVSVVSYICCVATDPGVVPFEFTFDGMAEDADAAPAPGHHLLGPHRPTISEAAQRATRVCDTCQLFKPARTHHCSHCNRCVLKYDHHCPWMGNCIGYHNYKFYLQFIVSTWFLVWIMNLTLFSPAAQGASYLMGADVTPPAGCHHKMRYADYVNEQRNLPPRDFLSRRIAPFPRDLEAGVCGLWMLPLFVLSILGQFWLGFLANRHQWLVRHNMTTVEMITFDHTTPVSSWRYSRGGWRANVAAVFGSRARWWDYIFPTTPCLEIENGVSFFVHGSLNFEEDL